MTQEAIFRYRNKNFENPDNGLALKYYVPTYNRALKKFFYNNLKFISFEEYGYCSDTTTNIIDMDSIVIYYDDFPILKSEDWGGHTDCNSIYEYGGELVIVFFDTKGRYCEDIALNLYQDFYSSCFRIVKDFHDKKGYEPIIFPKDTFYILSSGIPRRILYKYDNVNGFSIAKTCYEEYAQYQNDYTEALGKNAEAFCKKHKLSKVIFLAYIMVKKEND
jgi:hypothetical protein